MYQNPCVFDCFSFYDDNDHKWDHKHSSKLDKGTGSHQPCVDDLEEHRLLRLMVEILRFCHEPQSRNGSVYRALRDHGLTIVLHAIVACVSRFALMTDRMCDLYNIDTKVCAFFAIGPNSSN